MKILLKIILLVAVVGYLGYALFNFTQTDPNAVCSGLEVRIDNNRDQSQALLDSVSVLDILAKHKIHPYGAKMSELNLAYIDSLIEAEPCVTSAVCYINASNSLCLDIKTLHPVVRVMSDGDYYLDRNGFSMPVDNRYIDVPVVTGIVNKKWASANLVYLIQHLEDERWRDHFEQITVAADSTVTLVPRKGNHLIRLGHVENVADKLERLSQFYEQGLDKIGWNKYSEINLEYNNQIICTKKK